MKAKVNIEVQRVEMIKKFLHDQMKVQGKHYADFILRNIHNINMFISKVNKEMEEEIKTKFPESQKEKYKTYLDKHRKIYEPYKSQEQAQKFHNKIQKAIDKLNKEMPEEFKLSQKLNLFHSGFQRKTFSIPFNFILLRKLPEICAEQRAMIEIFIMPNRFIFWWKKHTKGFRL